MRVGSFALRILEGRETDSGYVEMPHGQVYRISLWNHLPRRCDATVRVDGKEVGGFRINSHGNVILERPADDTGKFTFFESSSEEARQANVCAVDRESRGLVQVTFRPERGTVHKMGGSSEPLSCFPSRRGTTQDCAEEKTSGGITGLTGRSDQKFHTVAPLDYEVGGEVTISVRLVCSARQPAVRELVPANANPVPRPVE